MFGAGLRSALSRLSAHRSPGSPRAGDVITVPDGSTQVMPKDWADMNMEDLAAIRIRPGQQPDLFIPR